MPPEKTKRACIPCRGRKRKCNGQNPCPNCLKAELDCTYDTPPPRKRRRRSNVSLTDTGYGSVQVDPELRDAEKSAGINSGVFLVRKLGLAGAGRCPRLCSWNLNLREASHIPSATGGLTDILSISCMQKLAFVYFAEVQPVYNFVDHAMVYGAIAAMSSEQPLFHPSRCVLLGIAALACLFSDQPSDLESQIVQHARGALEHSTTLPSPSVDHIVGWILRVLYLRMTGSPNATWLASCTMMHMIETAKLHVEPSGHDPTSGPEGSYSPQHRKRIYYIARFYNTWVSYDYGRARILPRGASCSLPTEGWTADDTAFWRLSDSLDPDRHLDSTELENMLTQTFELQPSQSPLQLKRCNIGMCIYRRLRVSGRTISSKAVDQVLQLADDGIQKATEMAQIRSPWWHVVNVPFQIVCVLLAIDTRASLERVRKALLALRLIADTYGTTAIRETFASACSLLRIQIRRKKEDYDLLNGMEEEMVGWGAIDEGVSQPGQPLPVGDPSQLVDMGNDGLGDLWDLDQIFSTDLFTIW